MRHTLPDDTTPVRNVRFHAPYAGALAVVSFEACIGDVWIGFRGWRIRRREKHTGTRVDPPAGRGASGNVYSTIDLPLNIRTDIRAAIKEAWRNWSGDWEEWGDDTG